MNRFLKIHRGFTAEFEGGYNDIKEDRGGATNWGISLKWLKTLNAEYADLNDDGDIDIQDIKIATKEDAENLFYKFFWERMQCGDLPLHVGFMLYDCSVNHGYGGATRIAQRAYNALHPAQMLVEDGRYGPLTKQAIGRDSGQGFIELWVQEREKYYTSIVERNHSQVKFINGWMRRAREMGEYACSLM